VKAFQAAHRLAVDGEVGPHTLAAMDLGHAQGSEGGNKNGSGGVSPGGGGGGGKGGGGGHISGDPVAIASKFLGLPSWSPKLRAQLGGPGWHYDNAGREGNNCAEFVSSCLRAAGEIGFQEPGVDNLETKLVAAGWKKRKGKAESRPNDVWLHNDDPSHTVLVASAGGGETIGADGSATEYIKQEPMPYAGAKYYYK
jgi:hypothetical protein